MMSLLVLIMLGMGLVKLGKLAAKNPQQSMAAASWLRGLFKK